MRKLKFFFFWRLYYDTLTNTKLVVLHTVRTTCFFWFQLVLQIYSMRIDCCHIKNKGTVSSICLYFVSHRWLSLCELSVAVLVQEQVDSRLYLSFFSVALLTVSLLKLSTRIPSRCWLSVQNIPSRLVSAHTATHLTYRSQPANELHLVLDC